MDALLDALLEWLGRHGDYDVTALPRPAVVELDAAALTREAYRAVPELVPASGIDRRLFALYSWEHGADGTIFVLDRHLTEGRQDGEDPLENPVFRERLLHELVHHAQYHTGAYARFRCPARGELDAYRLGGEYLRQRHVTDPLPNRRVLAYMYSRC